MYLCVRIRAYSSTIIKYGAGTKRAGNRIDKVASRATAFTIYLPMGYLPAIIINIIIEIFEYYN